MAGKPCVFRGQHVGDMVIGCCNGKDRKDPVYQCIHSSKLAEYTSESINAPGVANVEINGQRNAVKLASCSSCQLKLIAINSRPEPIVEDDKPKSPTLKAVEEMRRKRWPTNPAQRAIVYDCNRHGIGDAVIAAWIAEGAKRDVGTSPQVVLCANGDRKQLLEVLGQTIHYPVAPAGKTDHGGEYLNGAMGQGSPPFVLTRARRLGITADPVRPPVIIPDEIKQWSSQDTWRSDVLLFPQAFQRSRTWQDQRWLKLIELLQSQGLKVRVIGLKPSVFQALSSWTPDLSLMQIIGLIDRSRLVIGNDSGPMHITGTLDKTAIAVFGRTTDSVFSHTPSIRCVQAERRIVPCSGCWSGWGYSSSQCESSCKALESISADRVFRLAMELL